MEVAAAGVAVTLIDFTLSRLVTPDGATAFCDLEADPELFAGPKGDCQARRTLPCWLARLPALHAANMQRMMSRIAGSIRYVQRATAALRPRGHLIQANSTVAPRVSQRGQADTYRRMRKATRGDWAAHAPATNCMWLAYLTDTLLARKRVPLDAAAKRALRALRCGLPLPRARSAAARKSRGPCAGPCNFKGLIQDRQMCQEPLSAARLEMHACGHPCQLPCMQLMSSGLRTHKHATMSKPVPWSSFA